MLVILSRTTGPRRGTWWLCRCDCGNTKAVTGSALKLGRTVSCDCRRRTKTPIEKRFWPKVVKTSKCWNWGGARTAAGYGLLGGPNGPIYAHRYSFESHFGKIPAGRIVCHRCNNPACVRPGHLYAGTYSDNIRQAYADGLR